MNLPANISTGDALPALIDRAATALSSARTSAEVLEARAFASVAYDAAKSAGRMARAKDAHDDLIAKVYRAQADALLIEARAKSRLADEYDAAQERGEVSSGGGRPDCVDDGNAVPATAADIGLRRDEIHEARQIRNFEDQNPGGIERIVENIIDAGEEPTKAKVKAHVRGTFGTGDNEWYTPQEHIERARAVLGGIDLDPASSAVAQKAVRAGAFYDEQRDGLKQQWGGKVWMNPPYAQPLIGQFMAKLCEEYTAGRVKSAITLTHNYTDTKWFQDSVQVASAVCFPRGRIRFVSSSGDLASPTQGQAFLYFGADASGFLSSFSEIGFAGEVFR
jgi:hypothetical protein